MNVKTKGLGNSDGARIVRPVDTSGMQTAQIGGSYTGQSSTGEVSSQEIFPEITFWVIRNEGPSNGKMALTARACVSRLASMVVNLKPETESRLQELAATTGRAPDELVEDAMAGYLAELAQLRTTLDTRYDEIKHGSVKPINGEDAFNSIREKSQRRRHS